MLRLSGHTAWSATCGLALGLLVACGSVPAAARPQPAPGDQAAPSTGAQPSSPPLAAVKLGLVKLGAMADVWVAKQNGLFARHGLDIEIVDITNTGDVPPALQSRAVDIGLIIPGTAMMAKEQNFDLTLVGQNETAGATPPVSNALMVGSKSTINSVRGLSGLTLATSSPRGQSYAALRALFQREAAVIDSMQIVEAPFVAHADLLRSGQADAVVALDPFTTQITKAGYGRTLSWFMIETIPDQPVGAWWALRSWATDHEREIAAFNRAVKDAIDYMNEDPARAKQLVSQYTGLDGELVKDMSISWKHSIDPAVWQAVADMMYEQGELKARHDVQEYLSPHVQDYLLSR